MSIQRLLAEGEKAWWQFWKKAEAQPAVEEFTILGQEPIGAIIMVVILLVLGYSIYENPRWFFRGLAESVGWVVGLVAVGAVIGAGVGLYTMSLGAGVVAFIAFFVVLAFIMFAANAL